MPTASSFSNISVYICLANKTHCIDLIEPVALHIHEVHFNRFIFPSISTNLENKIQLKLDKNIDKTSQMKWSVRYDNDTI